MRKIDRSVTATSAILPEQKLQYTLKNKSPAMLGFYLIVSYKY
jgi:hypothetical protein